MTLFRAVFSAGQNAAILSALTTVFAQLTLVASDFVERRAEHVCVQPALVCDGRSIEATGQTVELKILVRELPNERASAEATCTDECDCVSGASASSQYEGHARKRRGRLPSQVACQLKAAAL